MDCTTVVSIVISIVGIFLNVIAVIVAPIISVKVAQKLQEKDNKRQDKMGVFKALMTGRIYTLTKDAPGWPPESVHALNIIDIVFSDDEAVRNQWKNYYDKVCVINPDEAESEKIRREQEKLLVTMANSLGYKDIVSLETIQCAYLPKGMANYIKAQQIIQEGQLNFIQSLNTIIPNNNGGNTDGQNANADPRPDSE